MPTLLLPPAIPFTLQVALTDFPVPDDSMNVLVLPGTIAEFVGESVVFSSIGVPVGSDDAQATAMASHPLHNPTRHHGVAVQDDRAGRKTLHLESLGIGNRFSELHMATQESKMERPAVTRDAIVLVGVLPATMREMQGRAVVVR